MRSGAAAGHPGYFHETAFYGSDDEFVDIVAPFVRDGIAAGEPTVVACGPVNAGLLERAVGRTGIRFLPGAGQYAQPGPTIRSYRTIFADFVAQGAEQIRVIGDVPHPGVGVGWHGWLRYEAAVNEADAEFPIWGMCPYDTRITPPAVLADVAATHPHLADVHGGHHRNDDHRECRGWLATHPSRIEPLEPPAHPAIVLTDPTPREARHALTSIATTVGLGQVATNDLLTATSETVTNAQVHGRGPVIVTAWHHGDGVTTRVTDTGHGPADPLAGLVPPDLARIGGQGLWLVHQLCRDVRSSFNDGYAIQFTVGTSPAS